MLPPGRARLATIPVPTGSPTPAITIGTSRVTDLAELLTAKVDAVVVQPSLGVKAAAELSLKHRMPGAAPNLGYARAGGLVAYSGNQAAMYRLSAVFTDKILKGAKPADLPIEQPTKFDLIINLKTAKALGLTIPPTILARADEVIE